MHTPPRPRLRAGSPKLEEIVVAFARAPQSAASPALTSDPLLQAVRRAGTAHLYADTADVDELRRLVTTGSGAIIAEIDGNTANQPLVHKVLARYLQSTDVRGCTAALRNTGAGFDRDDLTILLYAALCCRISNDIIAGFSAGRAWEISVQLHMGLCGDPEAAKATGRLIRRMVPRAFVKVPFTPQAPHSILVARDLENEGVPVNFTSTFSARQVAVAALLANVTRTNIFMGRLNQGLKAALLGEHVDLEAQRVLLHARRDSGVKTELIVASVREWQTFPRVAGCDVFTGPCAAIADFLKQTEVRPADVHSQLETSYEDRLGIADDVLTVLGRDRIARLYRVEREFVEFLHDFGRSAEYTRMHDGEQLARRFEQAGFGDFFYAPSTAEWTELRKDKLPDLGAATTKRIALDTLYTLLADADFEKYQEQMDADIHKQL